MAIYNPYWQLGNTASSTYNAMTNSVDTKWYGLDLANSTSTDTSLSSLIGMTDDGIRRAQLGIRKEMEQATIRAIKEGRDRVDMVDHLRQQKISFPIKQYGTRMRVPAGMPDWYREDRVPLPPLPTPRPLVRGKGESLRDALDRAFRSWIGYDPLRKKLQRAHNNWTKETRRCLGLSITPA